MAGLSIMRLIERPLRRSPALTVRTTIAACLALLAVAVGLGLRGPNAFSRSAPGDTTTFDYSALDARFGSLRNDYASAVLGWGATAPSEVRAAGSIPGAPEAAAGVDVIHRFTNDDFEHAYNVTGLPVNARTDTTGATRQSGEPGSCHPAGGTMWYRYRPRTHLALLANTFGTPHSTSLGVYKGTSRRALELIGCDTNALGNAQVGFRATKDTAYYFQLTPTVKGGAAVFGLSAVGPTTIESVSPSGSPADQPAVNRPNISADGRYVAFMSYAHNLAPTPPRCGDARYCLSLYLRDRLTGRTSRVATQGSSLPPDGQVGVSLTPSLSADGRYVGFSAHSLVEFGDYEGYRGPSDAERPAENAYLYDRVTGRVELVSRNSAGEPARRNPAVNFAGPIGGSSIPSVSADGRYVSFNSDAANLGGPIEPQGLNVYRRDRIKGITRLVSTDGTGEPMGGESCAGSGRNISGDGRYVVFRNRPAGLPETQGTATDGHRVYLWDAETGRSLLVSKVPQGRRPAGSYCPAISMDGSRVGLVSLDPLVPEDTNGAPDVYVYEVATGRLQRISVTPAGEQSYDPNYTGREQGFLRRAVNLSADGRFVVFDSAAPDLAPSAVGSTRHSPNITRVFLHDILTGATVLASVSSTGEPLPGDSHMPYISPDGRSVVFLNLGVSGQREVMVHQLR